jgi:anti-sigma B factor antagonist
MEYTVAPEGQRRIIHLEGALDVSNAMRLREVLGDQLDGPSARVLVDLSGVRLLDSSGIGILVTAHRRAATLGARLVLAAAQPSVGKVFELTRTNRLLRIVPSLAEGREALDAP